MVGVVDDQVTHTSSSIMIKLNNCCLEHGGLCEKSFEDLCKSVYAEHSFSTSSSTNGTALYNYSHLSAQSSEEEIISVKTELDDGSILTNNEIKTEPSSFEVELSVKRESSGNGSCQEFGDVLDNKDDEIISSEHLQTSISHSLRDVGVVFLPDDRSVSFRNVHLCGICSMRFRRASLLKRHEKSHFGGLGKRRKKSCVYSRRRKSRDRQRLLRQKTVVENKFVVPNSIEASSAIHDLESKNNVDQNENQSLDNHANQSKRRKKRCIYSSRSCRSRRERQRLLRQKNENQSLDNHTIQPKCTVCARKFKSEDLLAKHEYRLSHCQCSFCPKQFRTKRALRRHRKCCRSNPDWVLRCAICFKTCASESSLKKHILICQNDQTTLFECSFCGKKLRTETGLMKHTSRCSNNPATVFKCTVCSNEFVSRYLLRNHKLRCQNTTLFKCSFCSKELQSRGLLTQHERQCRRNPEAVFKCSVCSKEFRSKYFLRNHEQSENHGGHNEKLSKGTFFHNACMCTHCGKELRNAYSLKVHERQHTGERYQCDECDKSYAHPYKLKLHKIAHKEKPFACTFCDEKFAEPSGLNLHIRQSHFDERPHMCPKCGVTFTTLTALMKHEESHLDEKQFVCMKCGMRFADSILLERHRAIRKCRNTKFACTICGQKFPGVNAMNIHIRKHTGERPYKCTQCYKSFYVSSNLKEHIERVHSIERPFECLKCRKTFPTAGYLKMHDRSHQITIKTFACRECGKSFSARGGLKQHIRIHSDERPIACTQCSARFIQQSGLHRHIVMMHGDKVRGRWKFFDGAPSTVNESNADSLTYVNTGDYFESNFASKINVEMNDSDSIDMSAAPTIFEHTSDVVTDYFVPSPAKSELNDDGLTSRIEQALSSLDDQLLSKTEPQEQSPDTDSNATKHPISSVIYELNNKTDTPTEMANMSLRQNIRRPVGNAITHHISSVIGESKNETLNLAQTTIRLRRSVRVNLRCVNQTIGNTTNSCNLSSQLLNTFLQNSDTTLYQPGLSSVTSEQRTANSDEIVKKQAESDDDTVIDDDDVFNNDDHDDTDDTIISFRNDSFNRESQNNIIDPHENNLDVPLRSDTSGRITDLSINPRDDDVLSDHSDTIEYNDVDTAEESERLAALEYSESVDLHGSIKNKGDHKKVMQVEIVPSGREGDVKHKECVDNDQPNSEQCVDSLKGAVRVPKRRKQGKRIKFTACSDEKQSKRVHNGKSLQTYTCSHCGKIFKSTPLLLEHAKEMHDDLRPFKCTHCSMDFSSNTCFKMHVLRHAGVRARPFSCTECDKTFSNSCHVRDHIRLVHLKERPFACVQCDKRFPLLRVLKNHERITHAGVRKYVCDQCGQGCATAQGLKIHSRRHTGERPYACTLCDMSFHQAATFSRHMSNRHGTTLPHMCVKCGKSFATATERNRHESKHSSNKPHMCVKCGKSFATATERNRHESRHSLNKQTIEETRIDGDDKTRFNFTNIENMITSQARFPCETCGRKFTQRASLRRHNLIHTGDLPYECPVCHRRFRHNDTMRQHANKLHKLFIPPTPKQIKMPKTITKRCRRRKKSQEKIDAESIKRKLQCALCDKSYDIATCLRRHVRRIHEGKRPPRKNKYTVDEKPYVCDVCSLCYADARWIKRHRQEHD